ncbi:MAG: SMP-30/gluconolactonase/LRE family protein [Verrucomicrobia subdivision 3 bacterium]|nr:SMP-30/gluconolactonase/LRE family protein [Limisphaerales bacterium]
MVAAVPLFAQDMPLSQVLIPGEKWQLVVDRLGFSDAPTADDQGNFYFSDMRSEQGLFRVDAAGKVSPFLEGATGISGMKFGPDGKLYACRGRTRELISIDVMTRKITVIANDVRPNDLVVTHKGYLYFTETPKKQVTFVNTKTGALMAADVGITGPNGICLSPDQGTLAVSDFRGQHCWAFRIESNGALNHKQPYMTMRLKPNPNAERGILPKFNPSCRGDGMITDAFGRYYVTTELGVQYFDPTGRISGVIPGPSEIKGMTSVTFAGPKLNFMYITCFDKIYRMKTKTQGVLYQNGPQSYPPKKK